MCVVFPHHSSFSSFFLRAAASKPIDRSKEGQIRAIEKTFDTVSDNQNLMRTIRHPTNKSLTAVEVFPIYPDWTSWPNKYTHAVFDANPIGSFASVKQMKENSLGGEKCVVFSFAKPHL